jgi:hypothetical protein
LICKDGLLLSVFKEVVRALFDRKYVSVSLDKPIPARTRKRDYNRPSRKPVVVRASRVTKNKPVSPRKPLSSSFPRISPSRSSLRPVQSVLSVKAKPKSGELNNILAGEITHVFDKIHVAVIKPYCEVKVGDTLRFKGAHTDYVHKVQSMQIDHKNVLAAAKGQEFGLKITGSVRVGDRAFRKIP